MAVRWASAPSEPLYRIGRYPDPLAWPDRRYVGGERFDDPSGSFRVLYAAEQRVACFVETLAHFRPDLQLLAAMGRVRGSDEVVPTGEVPPDWCAIRGIARFALGQDQELLDLRAPETMQHLRGALAGELVRAGLDDFDVSDTRGRNRQVTRLVARWAYEQGFRGIAYRSRFGDAFDCWAVFEGAAIRPIQPHEPITADDPDLQAAMRLLGLTMTVS